MQQDVVGWVVRRVGGWEEGGEDCGGGEDAGYDRAGEDDGVDYGEPDAVEGVYVGLGHFGCR